MEELEEYFKAYNLFTGGKNLTMDEFKKVYFPHLCVVAEDKDDAEEHDARRMRKMVSKGG